MTAATPALALLAAVATGGCAHTAASVCPDDEAPAPVATQPEARPYHLTDGATGLRLDAAAWGARLRAARLIFVGEQHDDPAHHALQIDVLTRVHALDPSVAVALEMLPHTAQPTLDAFVRGKLDEAAFLNDVDWKNTWGFPYGLYRPLLDFARAQKLSAYALNAPRTLTRALSQGGIESLPQEQVRLLPEMVPGPPAHREFARQAFAAHVSRRFTDHKFERFYQAQLAWDETMASKLAEHAQAPHAPARIVVIAGEGHTRRFAVPARVARRGVTSALMVLAVEAEAADDARKDQVADVLVVFDATPAGGRRP